MYIKILIITEKNEHRPAVRLSSKLDMQFKRTFQTHAIINISMYRKFHQYLKKRKE